MSAKDTISHDMKERGPLLLTVQLRELGTCQVECRLDRRAGVPGDYRVPLSAATRLRRGVRRTRHIRESIVPRREPHAETRTDDRSRRSQLWVPRLQHGSVELHVRRDRCQRITALDVVVVAALQRPGPVGHVCRRSDADWIERLGVERRGVARRRKWVVVHRPSAKVTGRERERRRRS
jgi:hypothetical protein